MTFELWWHLLQTVLFAFSVIVAAGAIVGGVVFGAVRFLCWAIDR